MKEFQSKEIWYTEQGLVNTLQITLSKGLPSLMQKTSHAY